MFMGILIAFVLGFIGFLGQGLDADDAAYHAIQLFLLGGGENTNGSWSLEIARFLAPLSLSYAAVRGAFAVARANSGVLGGRILSSGHIVLISRGPSEGEGLIGLSALASSDDYRRGRRVVNVAPNAETLKLALRLSRARNASEILLSLNDDESTMTLVALILDIIGRTPGGTHSGPPIRAELSSSALWSQLQRLDFAGTSGVTWFNREASTASLFMEEMHTHADESNDGICSLDPAVRKLLTDESRLQRVSFLTDQDEQHGNIYDFAFICHRSSEHTIVKSIEALALVKPRGLLIVVCGRELSPVLSNLATRGSARFMRISPTEWASKWADLTTTEILARSIHSAYRQSGLSRGWFETGSTVDQPWDELPESLKQSNRSFAQDIGEKLGSRNLALRPVDNASATPLFTFTEDELEQLSKAEHIRFCEERIAAGWKLGERNPSAKTSPTLIPWGELSELERDKDRELVQRIPTWIRTLGYEIYR